MIIGIAGNINSGKDTVASILNYIISVGKHKATFSEWKIKQLAFDNSNQHRIIHFADTIKVNLSNIFCLSPDAFNNRKFKDELWYVPSTGKFIEEDKTDKYHKIELENYLELDINNLKHIVKLRTLLQLYGEHCKTLFGRHVWVVSTMSMAKGIEKTNKYCLIPDVRFYEEIKAIWENNGIVIRVVRPDGEIKSNHVSENSLETQNYLIENDSNLSNLFYKVLAIYENIKH